MTPGGTFELEDTGLGDKIDPGIGTPPPTPVTDPEPDTSGRDRYLNFSWKGHVGNSAKQNGTNFAGRNYYLDGEFVGNSNSPNRDTKIIQALINAGVAPAGKKVTWKVYHPDTADNVFKSFGLYTGGLVTEPGTYNLAEKGPEIVLNADDTKNILAAVSMMRQTVASQFGSINGSLLGSANSIANSALSIAAGG